MSAAGAAGAAGADAAILFVSRVWGSRHGGSLYAAEIVKCLSSEGARVTVLAEHGPEGIREPGVSHRRLAHFFQSGLRHWPGRLADIVRLWWLALARPCSQVIVQGDLPRLNYVLLQVFVPVLFIRQDAILTCPANDRFLPKSRRVCHKPVGISCLEVNHTEGCLASLSPLHRAGRIVYRLRDMLLLRCLHDFAVNSLYMARIHEHPAALLYPPNLSSEVGGGAGTPRRDLKQMIFCGRLEGAKGAFETLQILAALPPDYTLALAGDGAQREALTQMAASLGITQRVRFLGWLSPAERDSALASSGVLLMPSLLAEAFGMAGVEAFTQGTPAVAYDVGGVSEWCTENAGHLVRCGDIAAAAAAVLSLTQDPARWRQASDSAREIVRTRFPAKLFKEQLMPLIRMPQ